jgi:hypothetical protein
MSPWTILSQTASQIAYRDASGTLDRYKAVPARPVDSGRQVGTSYSGPKAYHAACCRRTCRSFRDTSNFRSLSAWISCCLPASMSFGVMSRTALFRRTLL